MTLTYSRKAWEIDGYTADADTYCPECAALIYDRKVNGVLRTVADERPAFSAVDFEGNAVHPIFSSDELEPGTVCGRCSEPLRDDDAPAEQSAHDRDLEAQHGWGQCDHVCCVPCTELAGEPAPTAEMIAGCTQS